ncbi:MAG: sulfatase-like hydrolase/transferase [Clostridia bacterium]|nr:sulfatase-like hydrolase/transferase [Clostridia bacterium]
MRKPKLTKEEKKALKKQQQIENHNKLSVNQIIKPCLFLVIAITLEIVNFAILKFSASGTNHIQLFPKYVVFDFAFWLIMCGIMLSAKNWLCNTVFYVALFLQVILCAVNASLYADFGYLFTWDMFMLAIEAIDSFEIGFVDLKSAILYLSLIVVFIALPLIIDKFFKKRKIILNKISRPVFGLITFLCCFFVGGTAYTVQTVTLASAKNPAYEEIESDKYLYEHMHIKEEAFKRFGTWGFYFKNFYDLTLKKLFPGDKEEILKNVTKNEVAVNESATLYGDNLIVVMLESYEWFAIDPYNTPNLWKLKTGEDLSGLSKTPGKATVMNNYYSNNKTNVSEDSAILGYMPNINNFNIKKSGTIATKYSLPNLFRNLDYTANFFHNWEETFYDRNTQNIYMGFENFYSVEDFKDDDKSTTFNYFNLETDYINQFVTKMAPADKKFMSFYTTVATHGMYTVTNPRFEEFYETYDANLENFVTWFEDSGYKYPETESDKKILRQYKCAAMDTDKAIGVLFDYLSNTADGNGTKLIDNTTVMLYADHNSYFHDLTYKVKETELLDYAALESYNVPLMIYSKKLGSEDISSFCNNYDLYPTICELFGLGYNKLFAQGYNIFSPEIENSTHVSYLTGYYTDKCYSKNMVDFHLYEGATEADIETLKKNVCKFYEKQRQLEAIYMYKW